MPINSQVGRVGAWAVFAVMAGGRVAISADAPPAAPAAPATAPAADTVGVAIKQAKATHVQALAAAKADLLKSIDTRIASASDTGDLKTVTALRAARTSAESDGSIPADVKDGAIVGAKIRYDSAMKSANTTMATAYQAAIREYTKSRRIEDAQGMQAEFEAFQQSAGLSATGAPPKPPAVEPVTRLGKLLPPLFNATGTYAAIPNGGIEPAKGTHLVTKPADFLLPTRDWVFDVWFNIKKKDGMGVVGIGDGHWEGSIAVGIRAPSDDKHGVSLHNGDVWGKKFGELKEPGDYMVRIEKTGPALTFSFGTEKEGKFEADCTRTINDPKDFMSKLSDKSAHLFFGGAIVFKQYRLNFKPPGAAPTVKPAQPATVVEPPKKKKK
jgi:hypothetical protein